MAEKTPEGQGRHPGMPRIDDDPDEEDKEVHCFTEPEESVVLRSQTVVKDGHVSAEKAESG